MPSGKLWKLSRYALKEFQVIAPLILATSTCEQGIDVDGAVGGPLMVIQQPGIPEPRSPFELPPYFFATFRFRGAAAVSAEIMKLEIVAERAVIARRENFMVVVVGYTYQKIVKYV